MILSGGFYYFPWELIGKIPLFKCPQPGEWLSKVLAMQEDPSLILPNSWQRWHVLQSQFEGGRDRRIPWAW